MGTGNKERPNPKTLDTDKFRFLRPDPIALYEEGNEEMHQTYKSSDIRKYFPSRLADVTVGPSSTGPTPLPRRLPPPPYRPPERVPLVTHNSPEIDKLYAKRKKVSGLCGTFTNLPTPDVEHTLTSSSSASASSSEADSQMSRASTGQVSETQLGPEEILPDTAEEIHKTYSEILEVDTTYVAPSEDVVFVDCLPSKERRPLPSKAQEFAHRRETSGISLKAEENYQQLKEKFLQRYQNAKAEILRRFPNQPKAPKLGRSGNNPNTKKPPKGKRVVIQWNEFGQPIGDWGTNFNNYLGCLAKRADLFNPYFMWTHQPFNRLEAAWRDLEKRPMRVDEIVKFAYGTFSPKYDKEDKKKKKLAIVDALLRTVQEAALQSQLQSDGESATASELPVDVQDRCVQEIFGPYKKNRYRLWGVGSRKPTESGESSTTSVTEPSSTHEPCVSREEFMEFKKNTEEMLQMRLKERELMISMASSMPSEQREKWLAQMALLWGSLDGESSAAKNRDDGPLLAQEDSSDDETETA
ncbi:uncharacterized protein A4U43_C05F28280 [Asparagus officinalis]|uniref:Uncharacterized protein n=1 Tax=Asparagus officinalis TaxID=4686 RepID=A0A5P1EVR2_ASPOF|nr:uncharacterized protein A4U43_C05F28280 [Asparagus officinalis]